MNTEQSADYIRVVKGSPDAEELAALTAVVMARAAAHEGQHGGTAGSGPVLAGWHRPERVRGFLGPRTWRDNTTEARSA
ncbi:MULTISPECIES: acyl-CoA carboxylase subunit epsilon [Streptomyces]|uniref:acyl-CoA carboxylase subunit epsilon n=1 Tax=Streptomyces TaxID=1883 RepID=UPI000F70E6BA|nr:MULTISPECIES: acyl-CoA carboxylase subunit epsilon [unclassified Streptomyces]AZM94085.1 acyl-CoA carboxylase subunit epsilon [Streptomyces sp. W1SF4]RSS56017.1 acyl-CoA carboxylase subunit epsilon [Streptomyces sp. WAC07061]